jgi:hypothetical protein
LPGKAALASKIAADRRMRPSDKVVAFALLFRFHNTKTGQCNPSYDMLAESCCLTRRAVIDDDKSPGGDRLVDGGSDERRAKQT